MKKLRWTIVAIALGATGAVFLNRETLRIYEEQTEEKARNEKRMQDAEKERSELLHKKVELEGPVGQEKLARERGYVGKGETPIESTF